MQIDDYETPVIFRKFKDGEIIALFPTIPGSMKWEECESYMHIGQHGAAYYYGVIGITKLASPEEYVDLFQELTGIGYNLVVYQKTNDDFYQTRIKELSK